ncbi:MAG: 3-oxoacid CoA-transferase subunit A, partial [SAR202 cluster bacterium]|nr:3-oxoacid CoA-transferase subunit A [SAR202 cluster bacterium]
MPVDKVIPSFAEAVEDIPDGAVVMMDGFGGPGGMPQQLILALRDRGSRELTIISNTGGLVGFGIIAGQPSVTHAILIESGQVKRVIASFPVSRSSSQPNPFELAYNRGEVDVEVVPQGTLAERIRAGGAGIAAFYTPTGVGTQVTEGKETRTIDGRDYLMEYALTADYAFIRASKAD